jgi:hypothetical protein
MKWLLLLIACFGFITSFAQLQPVQLHLKKNGKVKKRILAGTEVLVQTNKKAQVSGTITGIKDSTVFINGKAIGVNTIRKFRLVYPKPNTKINWELLAYTTMGVALSTAGMALSKWEKFPRALRNSVVIGYSPFVIKAGTKKLKKMLFRKDRYRIGGRFSLRVWDIN